MQNYKMQYTKQIFLLIISLFLYSSILFLYKLKILSSFYLIKTKGVC